MHARTDLGLGFVALSEVALKVPQMLLDLIGVLLEWGARVLGAAYHAYRQPCCFLGFCPLGLLGPTLTRQDPAANICKRFAFVDDSKGVLCRPKYSLELGKTVRWHISLHWASVTHGCGGSLDQLSPRKPAKSKQKGSSRFPGNSPPHASPSHLLSTDSGMWGPRSRKGAVAGSVPYLLKGDDCDWLGDGVRVILKDGVT